MSVTDKWLERAERQAVLIARTIPGTSGRQEKLRDALNSVLLLAADEGDE